jgi:CO dehydrogenase/acetyl-CoA synthase alpha subunit
LWSVSGQDNDTLYLGNIRKTWTKDVVREKIKEYEIENIKEMTRMDDPKKMRGKTVDLHFWSLLLINFYECIQAPVKARCCIWL